MRKKIKKDFGYWRKYSPTLDWMEKSEITEMEKRQVIAACYFAYKNGRNHERLEHDAKRKANRAAIPAMRTYANSGPEVARW